MPTLYFLIGVPGSGKSTWTDMKENCFVASTDRYIDDVAKKNGTTYSEEFKAEISNATSAMYSSVKQAIEEKKDIIWDQTSTVKTARAKKLRLFPKDYRKVAVFFHTPPYEILRERLDNRPGKFISDSVLDRMTSQLEFPTLDEGFDEIVEVRNFK